MGLPVHKSPDFVFHQEVPPSGGPPLKRLIDEFVTPEPDFFLRTHGSIPEFDCSTFGLTVAGLVTRPHRFSLKELRRQFPLREMVATLHCAGNRRVERVDVGYGEPLKWIEASFQDPAEAGIWRRWRGFIPKLLIGELICVRAWDSANTQPENPESVWNFKGYMNNAWHRVRFGMPWEDVKVAKPEIEYYL